MLIALTQIKYPQRKEILTSQVTELSSLVERLISDKQNMSERLQDTLSRQTLASPGGGLVVNPSTQPASGSTVDVSVPTDNPPFRPLFPVGK